MADNICPYCGFPNEQGVKVCKKCKRSYFIAEYSHVITDNISLSEDKETVVEKTDIEFTDESESPTVKKADISFDSEDKPTEPLKSDQLISRQFYAATFIQRLLSLITDGFVVLVCSVIIWFAGVSFSLNPNLLFKEKSVRVEDIFVSIFLIYLLFGFFYSTLFHHLSSRTIGKMILGLHLIGKNSYRVSIYRVILRNIFFILNFLTIFIGYIWIIADERGQALHDKLSGTFVVSEEIKR
ncbi:MAG: RDD family protein [Deltaproteobacteria bacterium]|nr:RDD family protein [Deltaproteobacteria bacterium]